MTDNPNFLDRRFDIWTQNLLDLSKRNRLLYFKPQQNTTIQLLEPDLPTIWQRLVLKNRTLLFHGLELEEDLFDDDEEGDLDTTIQRPLGINELRPDLSSTRLSKTLSYLRQRSRTSLEEQGVVTLFVAFGFLKWNEKGKNGLSGEDVFSPLLLVPVSLQRESARKPYTLKLWEDEVALNPVLKFRLYTEAKIQLPEPPNADDLDLLSYFQDVERAVTKQAGWSVWEAAYLGLFSFHKIAMYRDLQDNRDCVLSHPLVKALAGDSESVPVAPDDIPQGSQLDEVSPHEAWQVVDADSSQQEAIQAARRGVSFVLQGPPGTGKSQTITNIIAECLSDGKKVLFVSEKMAALQVVFNRLSQSGLADFCLEAHSHKANKREVVQELDRTLHAARKAVSSFSSEADQLSSLRKNINDYARELHLVHEPAELSAYEVSGYLAQLHDAPQRMFSYDAPSQVNPATRLQISDCLREMARLGRVLATHETHPWAGCNLRDAGLQTRDELRVRFERLSQNLQLLDGALRAVLDQLGLMRFPDWRMANRVLELVEHLQMSPCPPREWLEDDELTTRRQVAHELATRISSYLARSADLSTSQNIDFLGLPHHELLERLTTRPENIIRHITNENTAGDVVLSHREALSSHLTEAVTLLNTLQQQSGGLAATLQIDTPQTLSQTIAVTTLANHVVQNPQPQPHWFEAGAIATLEQKVQAAAKCDQAIATAENTLHDFNSEALLALDLDDWVSRFEETYGEALTSIEIGLRPELMRLSSLLKNPADISFHEAISDLQNACIVLQERTWLKNHFAKHEQLLSPFYNEFQTDWKVARETLLSLVQEAQEHQHQYRIAGEQLATRYKVEALLELDHSNLQSSLNADSGLVAKLFNFSYKRVIKTLQAVQRDATPLDKNTISQDLSIAAEMRGHSEWLKQNENILTRSFGSLFQGNETDWKQVKDTVERIIGEAEVHTTTHNSAYNALEKYHLTFLITDELPEVTNRLIREYSQPVQVVANMNRDIERLQQIHANKDLNSHAGCLQVLRLAREWKQLLAEREAERATHIQDFGRLFNGSNTDWPKIVSSLHCCAAIIENRGGQVSDGLQRVLTTSGDNIEIAAAQNAQLKSTLHQLQVAFKSLHDVFPLRNFSFSDLPIPHLPLEELRPFLEEAQQTLSDFFAAYDAANIAQKQSTLTEIIAALNEGAAIEKERQEMEQRGDECRALFAHFAQGLQTSWPEVLEAIAWTEQLRAWFGGNAVPQQVLDVATSSDKTLQHETHQLRTARQAVSEHWLFLGEVFPQLQNKGRPLENTSLTETAAWVQERVARMDELEEWLSWLRLQELSTRLGLQDFWNCALREKPNAQEIEGAFFRRFWSLWLDEVFSTSSALQHFSGATHEANIERFCDIDVSLLQISRNRLPAQLARDKPKPGFTRGGEIAVLQREALKKTRHKPLRQLFGEIPNVLQALKPCMLMSPLSVAQYLTPGKLQFDLVIFDEASQICSEDAIGAITRGAQLIVVGDRKQLPPSRFFGSVDVSDDEESEEGGEVYESILDECATIGLPDKMLRWHYRSRNEELIAFSNRHFYESNLVTFPGPYAEGGGIRGLSFEKVNGTYIRGKGKNARTNPIEARRVAELVVEHLQNSSHESLGVIAFNEAQMRAILGELQNYARSNPHIDALLYNNDDKEPFFVKNLENVQGDERDVIIFSIGYGPDENGKFSMNFGPLNRAGGERRLNVAVTRARLRVKVVASFEPDDIEPHRVSAAGPKLLSQYLAFAKNGNTQMLSTHHNSLSTIEESIAQALEARGWKIQRNIGFSDMRVDLAVLDPDNSERFLLGIECDGPSYAQAQTARDRDRLRIHVLQELGWNLVRIWSPDWIKNRNAQVARIEQALEAAKSKPTIIQSSSTTNTQTLPHFDTVVLPAQSSSSAVTNGVSTTQATVSPTTANTSPTQNVASSSSHNDDEDRQNPATRVLTSGTILPDGVTIYRECELPYQGSASSFYTLAESRPYAIEIALSQVVKVEGPIHIAVATRRVVAGWGMGRAGAKLLEIISKAAYRAEKRQLLQIKGEFLWPGEMQQPPVRVPNFDTPRPIGEIAPEEIAEAACLCIRHSFAVTREELIHQTARLLGFRQTGTNVRTGIESALQLLERDGRVRVSEDTFTVAV